jgi:hypothetical protein
MAGFGLTTTSPNCPAANVLFSARLDQLGAEAGLDSLTEQLLEAVILSVRFSAIAGDLFERPLDGASARMGSFSSKFSSEERLVRFA